TEQVMSANLKGKKVAILVTDGFEQIELTSPKEALERAGATTMIVSPKSGEVEGWHHYDKGDTFKVDVPLSEAKASDFDALLLPGGGATADQVGMARDGVVFVRQFFDSHKPVAAICHGPWTLIEAGVVDGRRMTSYKSVRTDLINAGAIWRDAEVVVDNGLV